MTSPGGKEVGRVSIRVVPDTHLFRRELREQLRKGGDEEFDVDINGNVNEKQLAREVRSAARAAGASVDIDANFRKSALDQIQEYGKQLTAAGKDLDLIQGAAEGLVAKIDLQVDPKSKKSWRDDINEELSNLRGLAFNLTPRLDGQGTQDLRARVAALKVPIEVEVDRNSIVRAFGAIKSGVGSLSKVAINGVSDGLQAMGSAALAAGKGFIKLGENGMIAVAVLGLIAPALALISGALVTLPAIMAAVLFPIGAIALGMDGIKKAAENAGLFSDSNGDKEGGGSIGAALDAIKKKVNDTFENGLKPAFEGIGKILNDTGFQDALGGVAQGLSDAFGGVTSALEKSKGALANIGSNIGKAFSAARPGIEDFTTGILNLVSKISDKFPGISDAINRTGKSFMEWVDRMTTVDPSTGVSKLDTAMKQLGDTLSEIGGLVTDFFNSGWENLSNVQFGDSMKGLVQDIRSLVQDTLPALANAFQVIASALKPIAVVVDAIDAVLNRLGAKSVPDLGGDQSGLETLFGKPGKWINDALNPEAAVQKALETGKQVGDSLNEGISTAALNTNAATQQAAAVAVAAKQEFDKTIASMPVDDQKSLISAALGTDGAAQAQWGAKLATAAASARDGITSQFDGVKDAVATKWAEINAAVTTGITGMQTTISSFFTALPQGFTGAFTGIQQSISGMFILIAQSISTQSANLSNSFATAFQGIPGRIAQALSGTPAAITGALAGVAGAVAVSMAAAAQAANEGGAATAQVAAASFGTVAPAISGAMQPCITTVSTICQQMVSTASSFAGAMEQSGVAIGASFARGIASQASLVASSANALMAAARAFFPNSPADEGPFSGSGWVDKSGASIGVSFADGISSSMKGVVSTARELMQAVKDVFGSAEGLTINFNLGGVADQAQAATTAVKDFGTAVGTIPPAQLKALQPEASAQESQFSRDELDRQLAVLEIERKSLELERAKTGANEAAIKARLEEIKQQKLQLGLQKNQLDYATKYGEQTDSMTTKMNQFYQDIGKKVVGLPTDFAKNVGGEFMNDLGISGQGAIPNLINEGVNYIFQVSDMQSALTAQRTLVNKQAAGVTQR